MTISESDKKALIEYRLKQAFESSEVAALLIQHEKFSASLNRIYYSAFYSVLALAIKYGFKTSKHLQLIGWFNKNFIATGKIETEYGRILRDCYEYRTSADYDSYVEFDENDVHVLFDEMNTFLQRIELFIKQN